ncbi:MAG: hypothetical protein QW609_02515 [Candidatus Aenigmatarchaeota archaeon]
MSEEKVSHCRLKLDVGVYLEKPEDLKWVLGKVWLDVVERFSDRPPTEIISERKKNFYVCKLYSRDKEICKREKCPAYQP